MGSNHTGFCRVLDDGGEEMHFGCVESMVRPARRRRLPPPVRFHSARRRPSLAAEGEPIIGAGHLPRK